MATAKREEAEQLEASCRQAPAAESQGSTSGGTSAAALIGDVLHRLPRGVQAGELGGWLSTEVDPRLQNIPTWWDTESHLLRYPELDGFLCDQENQGAEWLAALSREDRRTRRQAVQEATGKEPKELSAEEKEEHRQTYAFLLARFAEGGEAPEEDIAKRKRKTGPPKTPPHPRPGQGQGEG